MLDLILRSASIGFCAAVPLGPVAILCMQRTLSKGWTFGYSVGLGSSFGDLLYATIAVFSLAFISRFMEENKLLILVAGGALIAGIGIGIALANPLRQIRQPKKVGGLGCVQSALQGFLMTLSNPGALVLMLGLAAFFRLGVSSLQSAVEVPFFMASLLLGSNLWWVSFSGLISLFRHKVMLRQLIVINRVSGITIAVLGVVAVVRGLTGLV